jgi:hypothetical protein
MSRKCFVICLLLVVAGSSGLSVTGSAGTPQKVDASIEKMSWLAGCWKGDGPDSDSLEQWMQPAAGLMLGISRTVKDGRVREYEFMRITEANGSLVYTAIPSGQAQASFTLISDSDREFVFENKAHDFPQRIIYKANNEKLLARIEGTINGQSRQIDFPMTRVNCANQAPGK